MRPHAEAVRLHALARVGQPLELGAVLLRGLEAAPVRRVRAPAGVGPGELEHARDPVALEHRPDLPDEPLRVGVAHRTAAYFGKVRARRPSGSPHVSSDAGIAMP